MADELGIKISAELDTTKAESQLTKLKSQIAKEKTSVKIDSVEINQKAVNSSLKKALNTFSKSAITSPIKIAFDVNRTQTKSLLSQFAQSMQSNPIKIPVQFVQAKNDTAVAKIAKGTTASGSKSVAKVISGIMPPSAGSGGISASTKNGDGYAHAGYDEFRAVFEKRIASYQAEFEKINQGYKLSSSSVKYNPTTDSYSALIKYQNEIGNTISMLMRLMTVEDELGNRSAEFSVAQTGINENFSAQDKAIAKTIEAVEKYNSSYKDLYSKAFSQKNPLTGAFADEAISAFDKYKAAIDSIGDIMTSAQKTNLESLKSDVARTITEQQAKQYAAIKLAPSDVTKEVGTQKTNLDAQIEKLKQAGLYTDDLKTKFEGLKAALNNVSDSQGLETFRASLKAVMADVDVLKSSFKGQALQQAQGIDTNQLAKLTQFQNTLTSGSFASANTAGIDSLRQKIADLITQYQSLQNTLRSDTLTEDGFTQASVAAEMLNRELTTVTTTMKNLGNADYMAKMESRIEKLKSTFETLKATNTEAFLNPEIAAEAQKIEEQLKNVDAVNFSNVQASVSAFSAKLKAASATANTFGTELVNAIKQVLGLSSVASVLNKIVSILRTVVDHVKELDSAMTELKKVTNLSDAQYDNYLNSVGDSAKQLGATMTDLVNSTASFSRLGFNFEDAKTLAEAANIYYRVGDEIADIDDASQSLTSTMQAFGYSADEALTIVDKLNAAGNNMAISSGGIGTALQSSASALAAAGNSLDESISLIASANRVAQDPSAVGTAWRTVAARIRGAKTELEEAGDDTDGMVESTAKLQESIKAITGIDILEADGQTFKSTYQIIKEIAEVWGDLSDINQASLLEMIAGKRQSNIVAATLNNMADLEKSMSVTTNAEGSAMTEHERWMQSIEASEAKAQAAVEEFSNAFMSSSLVKFSYDATTGILGFLTKITETVGALPTALTALSGVASLFGKGILQKNSLTGKTSLFGVNTLAKKDVDYSMLGQIGTAMAASDATSTFDAYNEALSTIGVSANSFNKSTQAVINNILDQGKAVNNTSSMFLAYGNNMSKAAGIGKQLGSILTNVGKTLLSMGATMLVSWGVGEFIEWVRESNQSFDDLSNSLEISKTEYEDIQSEIESVNTEIKETNIQVESLQSKLTTTGLTFVEQSELNKLQQATKELETQKTILEGQAAASQAQINSDFVTLATNAQNNKTSKGTGYEDAAPVFKGVYDVVEDVVGAFGGNLNDISSYSFTEEENFYAAIESYKKNAEYIADVNATVAEEYQKGESANKQNIEGWKAWLTDANQTQNSLLSEISSFADNVTKAATGVTRTQETAEYLDWATKIATDAQEALAYAGKANIGSVFDVLWGTEKYKNITSELQELAEAGELTVEALSNTDGMHEFFDKLEDYGISIEDAVNYINELYSTADNAASTLSSISQYGTFDTLSGSLYNTTEAYTALKSAMDEQAKSGYLSVDTYKELIAKNAEFADYLELTAGGWRLNAEAVNEYIEAQDSTTRMNALAAIIDLDEQIADARENLVHLSGEELAASYDSIDALEDERNQLAMLVTSLDSASGAYQRYLEAKETADSSDMYDSAASMYTEYQKLRKSGRTGTDDFQTMTDFIMGENWEKSTDGTQESRDEVYKAAEKKYERYFGQDDEINGAVNFLKDVQKVDASLVSGNDKDGYLINAGVSMEQLAEAAGVSVDAVDSLIGLMEAHEIDFGREFEVSDEAKESVKEYTDLLDTATTYRDKAAEATTRANEEEEEGNTELAQSWRDKAASYEETANLIEQAAAGLTGGEDLSTMSVDELMTKCQELEQVITTLNSDGIDIPVSISEQYQDVLDALNKLGVINYGSGESMAKITTAEIEVSLPNAEEKSAELDAIADKERTADIIVKTIEEPTNTSEYEGDEYTAPGYEGIITNTNDWDYTAPGYEGLTSNLWSDESKKYEFGDFSGLQTEISDANSEMGELADNAEKFSDSVSSADISMGDVSAEAGTVGVDYNDILNTYDAYNELRDVALEVAGALSESGDTSGAANIYKQSSALGAASIEFENAYNTLKNTDPGDTDAYATASEGLKTAASNFSTAYSTLQTTLSGLQTVNVTANTSQALSKINALSKKTVTITVKANTSGISLPGNARGTSNAQAGLSLVDEEGAELIEHTSQGTFELGTNKGARLTNLDEGDIVHTASETKSILKRLGLKIGGSFKNGLNAAKSILTGGAFASGLTTSDLRKETIALKQSTAVKAKSSSSSSKKKKSSSSSKKSSSSGAIKNWEDYLDKLFDWVEVKLERLEESTNRWVSEAAEAVGYTLRNAKLEGALSSVKDQIDANTAAYAKYIEQADEVGTKLALTEDIISKIKDGSIEIASYDEDTQNKISAYKEWYDKAVECKDALYELREQEQELAEEKLDNILDHYQYRIDRLDAIVDYGDALIDLKNDTGAAVVASDYNNAIDATTQKIAELLESKETLSKEFASLVERGLISEGSEAWNDYTGELEDLDQTIVETKSDLQKLNDAVSQITITNLEYAMDALDATSEKIQGMMALHEAQGLDNTDTDYQDLIKNGMEQIAILEQQNAEYKKQQQGLDVLSEKYQELQSNIDKNSQSILDMKESQEEWNDSTIDLRIAQIQEYQEELNKANDKLDRQKQLEQAIEDLQKAKTQRTQRVYREGKQ